MKLIPIAEHPDHAKILWDLLAERTPEQSISHKRMPTWEEHLDHIANHTHWGWYIARNVAGVIGSVYLGEENNIGVGIFREFQRHGFGSRAVTLLMEEEAPLISRSGVMPWRANINPLNGPSVRMFEKLGFKYSHSEPMQDVYLRAA